MLTIIARALAICFIIFISLFALDVFSGNYGFWGTLLALFMHLIPSFILLAGLVIAWKRPLAGGALFLALGALFSLLYVQAGVAYYSLTVGGPLLLVGLLFICDARRHS